MSALLPGPARPRRTGVSPPTLRIFSGAMSEKTDNSFKLIIIQDIAYIRAGGGTVPQTGFPVGLYTAAFADSGPSVSINRVYRCFCFIRRPFAGLVYCFKAPFTIKNVCIDGVLSRLFRLLS